jgi:hypothetical protein
MAVSVKLSFAKGQLPGHDWKYLVKDKCLVGSRFWEEKIPKAGNTTDGAPSFYARGARRASK